MRTIWYIAVFSMLGMPALLYAQQSPNVQASEITAPPVIDGRLQDEVWSGLEPLTGFTQREPSEGQPVSQRTEVRIVTASRMS